ncbi:spore germination protein [Bacillus sp. 165]|uniref:spore germination protein n=1 Tax=Bacillus sp. 165 TaxID=1529117 RepID=UPI001AD9B90D|nr:spore germination protein [Bacillus sp. 165]
MPSFIRKLRIVNNHGDVHVGNFGNITPITASKRYNGSGGDSSGTIVNGKRTGTGTEGSLFEIFTESGGLSDVVVEEATIQDIET